MPNASVIPDAYRTFPLAAVIRDFQLPFALAGEREATLERLNALAPPARTLALLGIPAYHMGLDAAEGLHTFFFLSGGMAREVAHALNEVGLFEHAKLVTKAIGLFGRTYPLDGDKRMSFFGYTTGPDLNAFDRKLMAITADFAKKGDFIARVEDYVRASDHLLAMMRTHAQTVTPRARSEWLALQLWRDIGSLDKAKDCKRYLATPDPSRAFMAITQFEWEVSNGGLPQFFSNSSGAVAPEAAVALEEAGLAKAALLLREAIDLFGKPFERDRYKRFDLHFDTDETSPLEQRLYELSDRLCEIASKPSYQQAPLLFAEKHGLIPDIEAF